MLVLQYSNNQDDIMELFKKIMYRDEFSTNLSGVAQEDLAELIDARPGEATGGNSPISLACSSRFASDSELNISDVNMSAESDERSPSSGGFDEGEVDHNDVVRRGGVREAILL